MDLNIFFFLFYFFICFLNVTSNTQKNQPDQICLLLIPEKQAKPMIDIFDSLNEVVMKMVDLIMLFAPYAVFALLANVIVAFDDPEILFKLLSYGLCVVFGLILMIVFYFLPDTRKLLSKFNLSFFVCLA